MWGLTPTHLIIILAIVLIVVGPGKLPETGAAIGKALRGFKDAVDGEANATPASTPPAPVLPPPPYVPQNPVYTMAPPPAQPQPYPPQPYQPQPYQPQPYQPQPPQAPDGK